MSVNIKRLITFLLAVILVIGLPVSAMAATVETGTDETQSSATEETEPAPIEPTEPLDTAPTEITIPEEETEDSTVPADTSEDAADETEPIDELEASIAIMSLDDGIAAIAETEIVGAPNAFANLFLLNGGIDIPSFDYVQHKEHLPLYSVYLKDQPGYANNYYVAYCIEPGVELGNSGGHSGSSTTVGGMTDGSGALSSLTRDQVSAMGVALLYGETSIASRNDAESVRLEKLRRHAATQAIIWEIACGWRSSTPPYTRNNSTLYDAICPTLEIAVQVWGTSFNIDGIGDAYNEIVTKMAKHYTIPSFAASSQSAAKTYSLTPDGSGKYSITLTDTNNILSEYTFTNTSNVTYTVSGNKLTITASSPVTDMVVSPTKQVPNLENQVFYVWEYKEQQKLMSCKSEPANSAVPAYFKISTPNDGGLDLTKTTEDGKNLAGWMFGIYSDANCSILISGPHTTDSSGKISVTGLSAGTVYIKELGHTDAAIDALYKCTSTNPQKVTITSGKTAAVSFNNDLRTGYGKIVKETNTGENLSGWKFNVYTDAACKNPIDGSPFTTDSKGTITLELTPADYYVQEVDESGTNPDWTYDTTVRKLTVTADTTSAVTFQNTHYGYAQIVKQTSTGGNLGGWKFNIFTDAECTQLVTGSPFVSGADGTITARILPGTYFVVEVDESEQHPDWVFDDAIHIVTVEAGKTATVTIKNAQLGKAKIVKEMPDGGSIAGWEFDVYRVSDNAFIGTFTSGEDGTITTGYIEPGDYQIFEKIPDGSIYYCETENPQTVTVAAGQTASVTFTNRIRPGKIEIQKVDANGTPRAGAEFLLEWSEDGESWLPVAYSDSSYVSKGTCSSEGLTEGKLTSGEDGVVVYEGLHPELYYRLTETKAPEGLQLLPDHAYEGKLPIERELTVSLTVVNVPIFTLPETGSKSVALTAASLGICLAGLVGAILYLRKKKW